MNIQLFGGRGTGFKTGSSSSGESMAKTFGPTINQQVLNGFIDGQQAIDFARNSPSNITVNGTKYNWMSSSNNLDSKGNPQFAHAYQSEDPKRNGEYPVIEIVVTEKRRKRKGEYFTFYEFDRSTSGTKVW